jgi:SAM-dependent methyltransferase
MRLAVGSLNFPSLDEIRSFGSDRAWTGRPVVLALLVDRLEPERLLDVGCKGGWLIEHSQAPFKLGVDIDDAPGLGARADACKLPFRSASFDVVTLLDVIEHLPRGMEGVAFSEASRVLEPNGHLVVSTPADWRIGTLTDPLWMLYGHRHYKMSRLLTWVEQAGLDPVLVGTRGDWADVIGLPIEYACQRLRVPMPFGRALFRWGWSAYARPGRYTHFVVSRKRDQWGREETSSGTQHVFVGGERL